MSQREIIKLQFRRSLWMLTENSGAGGECGCGRPVNSSRRDRAEISGGALTAPGEGGGGDALKEESGKTHEVVQERSGRVWLGLREKVRNSGEAAGRALRRLGIDSLWN